MKDVNLFYKEIVHIKDMDNCIKMSNIFFRVLVFPCASGIGQEIHFALKDHKDIILFGMNEVFSNQGIFLYANYLENPYSFQSQPAKFLKVLQ